MAAQKAEVYYMASGQDKNVPCDTLSNSTVLNIGYSNARPFITLYLPFVTTYLLRCARLFPNLLSAVKVDMLFPTPIRIGKRRYLHRLYK